MSKKKIVFTDIMIKKLRAEGGKYTRSEGNGFTIRVATTGSKTWLYIYQLDGERYEMNLGMYPVVSLDTAREKFEAAKKKVKNGIDPKAEEKNAVEEHRKHPTIATLVEDYLTKHAKKKKTSWREDERILRKDVIPVWGNKKTKSITRRDVLDLLDSMQGRGDGIITNTFKIIRRMFRFAVKQEIIATTPCYAFEKGEELPRPVAKERNLSEAEVKAFMTGIDRCAISKNIRCILKLILLTGQRPGEIVSMHTSEISGRWWEFTPKETIITKQIPRKQRIYLSDMAQQLIGASKNYIFPSPKIKLDENKEPIPTHITERAVAYALRRNLTTHEVKPRAIPKASTKTKQRKPFVVTEDKKLTIEKFTPHDLRRTCATMLSESGFSDEVVDAVLSHLKKGEIRTYNKNKYDKEKQQAMESWELKLSVIIS